MKNQFSLKINKPCLENYNQFKPTLDGGFCGSCQKEVIDFSKMNTEKVTNYFKNKSNQDTCGKFNSNQLRTYTSNSNSRKKYSFWSGIGLACLSLFSFYTGYAQTKPKIKEDSKATIKVQQKEFIVKGTVSDEVGPISDINVHLQGTSTGTVTDFDGNFEFPKPLKKGDVLVFSHLSYGSKKITIENSATVNIHLNVNMNSENVILMGKVAVKKVYKSKRK